MHIHIYIVGPRERRIGMTGTRCFFWKSQQHLVLLLNSSEALEGLQMAHKHTRPHMHARTHTHTHTRMRTHTRGRRRTCAHQSAHTHEAHTFPVSSLTRSHLQRVTKLHLPAPTPGECKADLTTGLKPARSQYRSCCTPTRTLVCFSALTTVGRTALERATLHGHSD